MTVQLLGPDQIEQAVDALSRGRLVAFPTETVYGLGADARSADAVQRIYDVKGRPPGHPLIVHIADSAALNSAALEPVAELGSARADALALADAFWPGPLTIIVGRGEAVAPEAAGGRATVGLRVPDHPVTIELLRAFGRGVAGPSANRFGSVSPTTAAHVIDDLGGAVDHVLDGGPCRIGVESTIVDLTGPSPALLRPGGITPVEIEAVLGRSLVDERGATARASGMLASHYAPAVPVELVSRGAVDEALSASPNVGLIAPFTHAHQPSWALPADAAGYASRLYATLRSADASGLERLVVVAPDRGDLLDAVLDRLTKAAAPKAALPKAASSKVVPERG